jgi:dTDP-4-dehydrorhamnose reductase
VRVLITGAGGQLGHDLTSVFSDSPSRPDVLAADRAHLDVADRDAVLQAITSTRPTVVIHAGAWTAVDACEGDPDRAFRVNALGTRHVAEAAALVDAHLVYVSTDYVFDGAATDPYREWDQTNPLSVYGRSKLGGEREVQALRPGATIVRTSWVCGAHGGNMVKTVLRLAQNRPELHFVDDQHGCPTFTEDLAAMILRLATARLPGLFHVTNQGATTWYHFARDVLAAAGLDPDRVKPIATAELQPPRPAPRPANSVLDNAALRYQGIPLLDDHHIPLERLVKQLIAEGAGGAGGAGGPGGDGGVAR